MSALTHKSAKVVLELQVGSTTYSLSHVGNNFLIARGPCSVPPETSAELRVIVDDLPDSQPVFLPNGISAPGVVAAWF